MLWGDGCLDMVMAGLVPAIPQGNRGVFVIEIAGINPAMTRNRLPLTGSIEMKQHAAGFAALIAALSLCGQASAETVATLTKGQSNPIVRGVRVGSEQMASKLGAMSQHFIPRTENSVPEQIGLVDEVLSSKPD